MNKLLLLTMLLAAMSLAAKIPGWQPGYHYQPDPTHNRAFRTQQQEEEIITLCDESEEIIEGIPVTNTNGTCHNLEDTGVGASLLPHRVLVEPTYIDSRTIANGKNRPGAREISNAVVQLPAGLPPNVKLSSRLLIMFRQFMDHDFALILEQEEIEEDEDEDEDEPPIELYPEVIEVEIPEDDENFDPEEPMEFTRSEFLLDENFVRIFENELTPWLDLGPVYGDTQNRTDLIRAGFAGRMAVFIAPNNEEFPLFNETTGMFVCGDIRCEENTMLFSWHTIWLRNHNVWAETFVDDADIPEEDLIIEDDRIFENARIRNIVQYQYIVWEQYLPYLLGRRTFEFLTGDFDLDEDLDPVMTLIFTTAVFRYGHSGVPNDFVFLDTDLEQTRASVALAESFNFPDPVLDDPDRVAEIFIGQASLAHDILDSRVVSGIRDNLFANIPMFAPGFDLVARNIERGRDHGIETINPYRQEFGLDPYTCAEDDPQDCFDQLTSDTEIAEALFELYGDISECEMWVCGMAEDSFEDSLLGETFTIIMAEQFNRMRNADRIWYDNIRTQLEDTEIAPVEFPVTLTDIVRDTTDIVPPFENMFMVEGVWEAFTSTDAFQVEWYLPPSLRGDVSMYIVNVNGQDVAEVEIADTLFYYDDSASSGTNYDVSVTAVGAGGADDVVLGEISVRTDAAGLGGGAIAGIVIGSAVGAVALGAGVWFIAKRMRYNKIGAGQDTFLQL